MELTDWRSRLRAEVAATGPDFAAYLGGLGATGWAYADAPELAGLEAWGTALARRDHRAGVGALVRVAQLGLPRVLAAGGDALENMGFRASEPQADGAPVEAQLALAAAWLDAPDAAHVAAVRGGIDPTRQLHAWDDDLRPEDEHAYFWYLEVGQCCGLAITRDGGDPASGSSYDWDGATCVGRGLVLAVRGLRLPGVDLGALIADVRGALAA